MKSLSIVTLAFIAWNTVHSMDVIHSDFESESLLNNNKTAHLLSDKNHDFIDHSAFIKWAVNVKKENATHKVEGHLIELFWQLATISSCIQNDKVDNAFSCLKVINSLYKEATLYRNSILNDTWTQCLKIQDEPFLEEFVKDEYTITPENDIDSFLKSDQENPKELFKKIYDQHPQELIENYQSMLKKVTFAGATLNNCTPDTWRKSVQIKEFSTQKKELKSIKPIKKKNSCIIN